MFATPAFAQAAGGAGGAAGGLISFVPILLIFAIMYFLMIRPQQKKVKDHKAMVEALRRGDQVVTSGGMIGKVTKVADERGRGRAAALERQGAGGQVDHQPGDEQDRARRGLRRRARALRGAPRNPTQTWPTFRSGNAC